MIDLRTLVVQMASGRVDSDSPKVTQVDPGGDQNSGLVALRPVPTAALRDRPGWFVVYFKCFLLTLVK